MGALTSSCEMLGQGKLEEVERLHHSPSPQFVANMWHHPAKLILLVFNKWNCPQISVYHINVIGAEPQLLSKRLNFFSCILQSYLPGLAADTRVEGSYFKSKDFHKRIGSTHLRSCCPHHLCDQQRQKCRWLSFLRVRSPRTDGGDDDCCVKTFEKCRICTCVFYHLDIGDNDSWL